jgi:hypothetical protein
MELFFAASPKQPNTVHKGLCCISGDSNVKYDYIVFMGLKLLTAVTRACVAPFVHLRTLSHLLSTLLFWMQNYTFEAHQGQT